jgi:hypothetical protein
MLVVALTAVALAAAPAHARVGCSSGATVVRDRALRILGVPVPQPGRRAKVGLYACLRGGPTTAVGQAGYPGHPADSDVEQVVFDGHRYLATITLRGNGTSRYRVFDLRRRRQATLARSTVTFAGPDPFRLTLSGALARSDFGVQLVPLGFRGADTELPLLGSSRSYDLAYVGSTLYWSDSANPAAPILAGSASVAAPAATPENRVYDIARLGPYNLERHRDRCSSLRGRTIAASVHVRVVAQRSGGGTTQRYACAIGLGPDFVVALGPPPPRRGELRIVGDRWLLSRTTAGAIVIDASTGGMAARAPGAIQSLTVSEDGRLAWIDGSGRLLAARSHRRAPVVLAEGSDAPTALASSEETIYWTSAGAPRRWQP